MAISKVTFVKWLGALSLFSLQAANLGEIEEKRKKG